MSSSKEKFQKKFVLVEENSDEEMEEKEMTPGGPPHPSVLVAQIKTGGRSKGRATMKGDGKTWSTLSQGVPGMKFIFPDNKEYRIVQSVELSGFVNSTAAFTSQAYQFLLSNLAQAASFQAVFDQYRFDMIELWIMPSPSLTTSTTTTNRGLLYSVIDYDDATALATNAAAYEQYSNCVVTSMGEGHYRKFVPHMAMAAYNGAFTAFANQKKQWIDIADSAVAHYGVKIGGSVSDAAGDVTRCNVVARYHISFRNLR